MKCRARSSSVSLQWYLILSTAIFATAVATYAAATDAIAASIGDPMRDARCFAKCYRQIAAEQPKVRIHTHTNADVQLRQINSYFVCHAVCLLSYPAIGHFNRGIPCIQFTNHYLPENFTNQTKLDIWTRRDTADDMAMKLGLQRL